MFGTNRVEVKHFNLEIEQNPEAPGFWEMWNAIFVGFGYRKGDYIVASEPYGQKLAEKLGGIFMPYDLNRSIAPIKATYVRNNPFERWNDMIPEFRRHFVQRVTIFGAESVGKTTMSDDLAHNYMAPWLFEWARPYLEAIGPEVTDEKMHAIHKGQLALQKSASHLDDAPVIFQDTDLFSTVGYWKLWKGKAPVDLVADAINTKSDLYLIPQSNIPFEADPLRYGGDKRESPDSFWIKVCEDYNLNYRILTESGPSARLYEAARHVDDLLEENIYSKLRYERTFNG